MQLGVVRLRARRRAGHPGGPAHAGAVLAAGRREARGRGPALAALDEVAGAVRRPARRSPPGSRSRTSPTGSTDRSTSPTATSSQPTWPCSGRTSPSSSRSPRRPESGGIAVLEVTTGIALEHLGRREVVTAHRAGVGQGPGRGRRRGPGRRGPAGDADGHHLGDRGHGDRDAPAPARLAVGLSPRGPRARPGPRGPAHHAAATAALVAGHAAGDAAGEPAGAARTEPRSAAHASARCGATCPASRRWSTSPRRSAT